MKPGASFLDAPGPRVFTMPPGAEFLPALVRALGPALAQKGPFALSDAIILAPTRRAARALAGAFADGDGDGGKGPDARLLPRIRALGDIDADEPPFAPGALALQTPPPLSAEQKLFDLAALVQARQRASGQHAPVAAVLAEAEALSRLIDEAETEGVTDFDFAREAFQQHLASAPEHVQRAALFLDIVMRAWPEHLHACAASGPAAWRAKVIGALAQTWRERPPAHIVVAAGSTGSVPATADVLGVIAGLPAGAIILPGLDESLGEAEWKAVLQSPGHPQHGMARLLRRLHLSRAQVRRWPGAGEPRAHRRRRRLINEALLPAEATADWSERLARLAHGENLKPASLVRKGLAGLELVEADNEDEEAQGIALAIRHTLSQPGKTAMLVTPDRALAQRVRMALTRWGIDVDDSAGTPLDATPAGVFLTLLADCAAAPDDPVALAALLASPLTRLGLDDGAAHTCADALQKHLLRGVQRHSLHGGLHAAARQIPGALADIADLAGRLELAMAPFAALQMAAPGDWAKAHAQAGEALAASAAHEGAAQAWRGQDGAAAAALLRALMHESANLDAIDAADYAHLFAAMAHQRPVRPVERQAPRVRILGPLEARMMAANLVILGGLNETVWPANAAQDPFLPRNLRLDLGLPDPERRLGLAAHDFAEQACTSRVLLSRSRRLGGSPAVASRWLWRLQTLIRAAGLSDGKAEALLRPEPDYLALARQLDRPSEAPHLAPPPNPRPPLSLRPDTLYVTRIKTLVRNPYAIYARSILRLAPLEALGATPGPAERGSAIHAALEAFAGDNIAPDSPAAHARLMQLIEDALLKAGYARHQIPAELARARRAVGWFLPWEAGRRAQGWRPVLLECHGALELRIGGRAFTLKARADRIDRGPDGLAVLDYKTGAAPTASTVVAGFEPQLPLEAVILQKAGFADDAGQVRGKVSGMGYIALSGGATPGKFVALEEVCKDDEKQMLDAPQLQARALDQLHRLIKWFGKSANPYRCQPRAQYVDDYSDYDLLARRPEWDGLASGAGRGGRS